MTSNYPNYVILSGWWCSYGGGQQRCDFPVNKWSHLALVRHNEYYIYYIDGKEKLKFQYTNDMTWYRYMCLGNGYYPQNYIRGYIDSLRIANHAVYTEEFTPRKFIGVKQLYIAEDKKVYANKG